MQKYMRSGNRYRFRNETMTKWPVILLAIIMFAAGFLISKMTVGGGLDSGNFQTSLYQEMRNEAKNAASAVNKLSRNNGTSSDYQTLAEVKASISSLSSLNDVNVAVNGERGRVFQVEELNNALEIINLYYSNLSTGTKVTENLTLLSETVNSLYSRIIQLLGE